MILILSSLGSLNSLAGCVPCLGFLLDAKSAY
jgi:hypothetical protein